MTPLQQRTINRNFNKGRVRGSIATLKHINGNLDGYSKTLDDVLNRVGQLLERRLEHEQYLDSLLNKKPRKSRNPPSQ